jgi:hypothetical protein
MKIQKWRDIRISLLNAILFAGIFSVILFLTMFLLLRPVLVSHKDNDEHALRFSERAGTYGDFLNKKLGQKEIEIAALKAELRHSTEEVRAKEFEQLLEFEKKTRALATLEKHGYEKMVKDQKNQNAALAAELERNRELSAAAEKWKEFALRNSWASPNPWVSPNPATNHSTTDFKPLPTASAYSIIGSTASIDGIFWLSWFDDAQKQMLPSVFPNSIVDLVVTLSTEESRGSSVKASPQLMEAIRKDVAAKIPTHKVIVRSYILGTGNSVEFADKSATEQTVTLDLSKLAARGGNSEADVLATIRLPLRIKNGVQPCFQIAVTFWDNVDYQPLDHLVVTAPTSIDGKICSKGLQGGFGNMTASLVGNGQENADGAFHIFEYMNSEGDLNTRFTFFSRGKYEKSGGKDGLYSWTVNSSFSLYASSADFYAAIKNARGLQIPKKYSGVAEELKKKMFAADEDDEAKRAEAAFASLEKFGSENKINKISIRYVNKDGKSIYIPFGLLNSHPRVFNKFTVSYALPTVRATNGQCLDNWAIAYPKVLSGHESYLRWDKNMDFPVGKSVLLDNMNSLKCYFKDESAIDCPNTIKTSSEKPEALVLLAHQSKGLIWYSADEPKMNRIPLDTEPRKFAPGSVAFLSACSVADSSDNADVLLNRLNKFGMDAIVASPFPVDEEFGVLLSRSLIKAAAESYKPGSTQSVYGLFLRAIEIMKSDISYTDYFEEMSNEFVILGKQQLETCNVKL